MDLYIVGVVIIISMIQSIFGVGVLLFGTPILLILGYDFVSVLSILLPISLSINFLQIVRDKKHIDVSYYKLLLQYSILPIVLCLVFSLKVGVDVSVLIGVFLLLTALKPWSLGIEKAVLFIFKFERPFFVFQGVIHGLTNLGGSLLTSHIHTLKLSKVAKRATISMSYFTFAFFQISTLIFLGEMQELNVNFLVIGVITFILTEYFIYSNISNKKYDRFFAIFLFISGLTLIYNSVF